MTQNQHHAFRPLTAFRRSVANMLFVAGIAAALIVLGPLYVVGALFNRIRPIRGGGQRRSLHGVGRGS